MAPRQPSGVLALAHKNSRATPLAASRTAGVATRPQGLRVRTNFVRG